MSLGNRYDTSSPAGTSLSYEIVATVAEENGVDPLALSPPLASVVDVESVETAIEGSETPIGVSFEYAGLQVEIQSGSNVTVRDVDG